MNIRKAIHRHVVPAIRSRPTVKKLLTTTDVALDRWIHSAGHAFPSLIKPKARHLTIALTSACNLRCQGCLYGRGFMSGHQLSLGIMKDLLDDAGALGFELVRLYGGEPLLYKALPEVVRHTISLGMSPYVTTNGIILREKVDRLFEAGLRNYTIGFYGVGGDYDAYVQQPGSYKRLLASLTYVRDRYGDKINLRMNWLLHRQSCSIDKLRAAWDVAQTFNAPIQVDLVHYSLPYFTEGPSRFLQFRPEDKPAVETLVNELDRLKRSVPASLDHTLEGLASIPEWLIKGPAMRVPCDKYQMTWVGADGTVQLCYATFKLGNLNERRLKDMLFTALHNDAAQSAFKLNCPNCHCGYDSRIQKDRASLVHFHRQLSIPTNELSTWITEI